MWTAILDGLGWLLAFFYGVLPSAGIAIILLTIVIRLVLFPLTAKQAKSMIEMQRVQPELKKLQAKYKHDRQKLNEEMMRLYKEHNVNPLGGCLPLVVQMPVFIALYQLLRHIPSHLPKSSSFYQDICPKAGKCTRYVLDFLGMDLAKTASANHGSTVDALPYFVLIALVVGSAFLQQRQTMRSQTQANPQMQMIGKVMPLVFAFISIGLPAGVVLYYLVSNIWQIGQQEIVYRTIGSAAGPPPVKGRVVDATSTEAPSAADRPVPSPEGGLRSLLRPSAPTPRPQPEGSGNGRKQAPKRPGGSGNGAPKGRAGPAPPRRRNNRKRKR